MNRVLFEYHSKIGYRFMPDLKVRIQHEGGGYFVKTNNFGFRSDYDFYPQKQKLKRILVFGDSFTAGDGVSNKYRYTDIINNYYSNNEVYNFGLPGSGTDQQYILFKEYAPLFEHDLIVIAVLVENIRRVNSRFRLYQDIDSNLIVYNKPYFEIINGELLLRNTPVDPIGIPLEKLNSKDIEKVGIPQRFKNLRKFVNNLGLKDTFQKFVKYQPVPEYSSTNNAQWLLMKTILQKWISESSAPVILFPLPLFHHVEKTASSSDYQKRFKELNSLCFIHDPLPDLWNYDLSTRRNFRFKKDVHLTQSGHNALALSLMSSLMKLDY